MAHLKSASSTTAAAAAARRERQGAGSAGREGRGRVKVAVGQMTSTGDVQANFDSCQLLVEMAVRAGAKFLSLPECFSFIGERDGDSQRAAQPLDGPIMGKYRQLARDSKIWLSLGGFQEAAPGSDRIFNCHVILDDEGGIRAAYRKIHLFDVDVPGGPILQESKSTAPGSTIVSLSSPIGCLGLTICYDLRFPELFQRLRLQHGAEVILVPSAFTVKTGEAHWEVLLRARAIETQCYVLAAAQAGRHNERRESHGHALVIDPWGKVIAQCEDPLATDIAVAEIDHDLIASIRQRMPINAHIRYDIYGTSESSQSDCNSKL